MAEDAARTNNGVGVRLSPDPTVLTRDAIVRDLTALREILQAQIEGNMAVLQARLDGNEKAVVLLQTAQDRIPGQMDDRVSHMTNLFSERFNTVGEQFRGIGTQFDERDVRVREAALSQTTAVNAALQAQKEAAGEQVKAFEKSIDKSETGTTKQIDALFVTLTTASSGLDAKIDTTTKALDGKIDAATTALSDKINALKERIDRGEGAGSGRAAAGADQRAGAGEVRAYIGLAFTALVAIIALAGLVVSVSMR